MTPFLWMRTWRSFFMPSGSSADILNVGCCDLMGAVFYCRQHNAVFSQ